MSALRNSFSYLLHLRRTHRSINVIFCCITYHIVPHTNFDCGLFHVWQYTRPASDVNMLGEMMFGSVAMSYKGSTLKIHYIRWVWDAFSTSCEKWNGDTGFLIQKCISPPFFCFLPVLLHNWWLVKYSLLEWAASVGVQISKCGVLYLSFPLSPIFLSGYSG